MRENESKLTKNDKAAAIMGVLNYVIKHDLPMPHTFITTGDRTVIASTTLWPFEAPVQWDSKNGPYNAEILETLQIQWLKAWIKDVAHKVVASGVTITKKWQDYFTIVLDNDDENWQIVYGVKRDVLCERVVKSRKIIPARKVAAVPEHMEPEREEAEYDWVCNDKALLDD